MNGDHDERCFLNNHSIDEYMAAVGGNIAQHGQHVVGVLGKPPVTYTVGLLRVCGYELIVYGLPHPVAAIVLNDIAAAMRDGLALELDKPYSLFTNLPVKFLQCGPKAQLINGVARRYYGGAVPMVQMVLSDREGKFPDEAGFDRALMDPMQPLLQ